jgi:hypothetical protein
MGSLEVSISRPVGVADGLRVRRLQKRMLLLDEIKNALLMQGLWLDDFAKLRMENISTKYWWVT